MTKKFVVIGASAASVAFMTKLRSFDATSEIVCIADQEQMPYNRCLLAEYLAGKLTWEQLLLKPDDFFAKKNITMRLATRVTSIDSARNCVYIGSEMITYDHLFIGVGARAFVPPIPCDVVNTDGLHTFYTAQDVHRLLHYLATYNPASMIVIGGGLNGIECADALLTQGVAAVVLERSAHILATAVDHAVAQFVQARAQNAGLACILQDQAMAISQQGDGSYQVQLTSGKVLLAQGIVFATGAVANGQLLQDSGLAQKDGRLLVDAHMRTNIANISAGGDICLIVDSVSGALTASATWSDAMLQGLCAATVFATQPRAYSGYVGLRNSVLFGLPLYACGKTSGHDASVQALYQGSEQNFQAVYLHNNRLIGFVLVGDTSCLATYKQWYLTQKNVVPSDF